MKLRTFLILYAVLLALLTALVAASAIGMTLYLRRAMDRALAEQRGVQSIRGLQRDILLWSHSHRMYVLAGERRHLVARNAAEREALARLDRMAARARTSEEQATIGEIAGRLEEYFGERRALQERAAVPVEDPELEAELVALEDLAEARQAVADSQVARATRTARLASAVEIAAIALAAVVGLFMLLAARALIIRPLARLRASIVQFGAGRGETRAPEVGLAELRDVARVFNRTADTLERQIGYMGAVAHDLRNPLGAMGLVIGKIQRGPAAADPGVAASVSLLGRQVQRLERMVDDLLDAARIEAGRLDLRLGDVDLVALVSEVAALHRPLSSAHIIDVDAPDHPVIVRGDGARLAQALGNLVSNAVKYSPGGGPVDIAVSTSGKDAVVSVSDRGVGIPPEERERIFEPFQRGGATREQVAGAGLGLSIVRRIVEAHEGAIEVEGRAGGGSRFILRLPKP